MQVLSDRITRFAAAAKVCTAVRPHSNIVQSCMQMNLPQTIPALLLLSAVSASAAQFESVIDALAIKAADAHTNNGWEDTSKIKGVKWKWPYYESGAHDRTMVGITKVGRDRNPNVGAALVMVNGMRGAISSVAIRVENQSVEVSSLGKGKATRLKTTCDEDSGTNVVEFYRFEKTGYKPLYLSYQSSSGAGGAGTVELVVTYTVDDALGAYTGPCSVR